MYKGISEKIQGKICQVSTRKGRKSNHIETWKIYILLNNDQNGNKYVKCYTNDESSTVVGPNKGVKKCANF